MQTIHNKKKPIILYIGFFILAIVFFVVLMFKYLGYGISYQYTGSMPIGWYLLLPISAPVKRGDILLFNAPLKAKKIAVAHRWMFNNEKMLKKVAAISGDEVCIKQHKVFINQKLTVLQLKNYAPNHPLPIWHFCGKVPVDKLLMLSNYAKRSFDGRYFGFISNKDIIAKALPIGILF